MNKALKTAVVAAFAVAATSAIMAPVSVNAWGDSNNGRQTYTVEQINAGKLGNTITFNSITNGLKINNELNFVGAKIASANGKDAWYSDKMSVKDGDVLTVILYVHNNSPKGKSAIAENVMANFVLPTTVGKSQTIKGYINSSNANPKRYWDEVELVSDENFYIEFEKDSAKYTNAKENQEERTFDLSNEIVAGGVMLGYDKMDGKIPGCYQYDGYVTIKVKVHAAKTSKLVKQVRIAGTNDWSESVDAKVGDKVEYQIEYENLTAEQVDNVMIRDFLPNNMKYIDGTTKLYNAKYPNWTTIAEDTITTTGINIGNYKSHGNAWVRFTAEVVSKSLECGTNKLVNRASVTINSQVSNQDDASVIVAKNDETCQKKNEEKKDEKKDEGKKDDTKKEDTKKDDTKKSEPVEKTDKIVNTGAGEVAGAALGAGSLVTALGYYIASRKKLM